MDSPLTRTFSLKDAGATKALGARLARHLTPGDTACLYGPLGAGKTLLARGAIHALTGEDETPSPTYALALPYEADGFTLWHLDLYRIEDEAELHELGLDEMQDGGCLLVEWPERLGARLPPERLEVRLAIKGEGRTAELTGLGTWETRLARL